MNHSPVTSRPSDRSGAASPRQRVLFLTHRVPYPPDRGDRIRAFHILQFLAARYDVSLAAVSEELVTNEQQSVIESFTSRFAVQQINSKWSKLRGLLSLALGGAVSPAYFYRPALARTIADWHRETPFDAVVTFCTGMINYARAITRSDPSIKHIIDLVDVDSAKWTEYARNSRLPMRWIYAAEGRRLRTIEAGERDRFDAVGVVSEAEANIYRKEVGDHPGLIELRHAVDVSFHQPMEDAASQTITFIGVLNYKPNVEGIIWFVHHVMPLLRQRVPGVKLQIIGRHPSPEVVALGEHANVEVVGSVPDVRDYLRSAAASIAPLKIARGVQTKVLEAMASSRVAICSRGAAEGIHGDHGQHLFICDSPLQWAQTIERVIGERDLRLRIAAQARQRIETLYRFEKCYEPLEKLISHQDTPMLRKAA